MWDFKCVAYTVLGAGHVGDEGMTYWTNTSLPKNRGSLVWAGSVTVSRGGDTKLSTASSCQPGQGTWDSNWKPTVSGPDCDPYYKIPEDDGRRRPLPVSYCPRPPITKTFNKQLWWTTFPSTFATLPFLQSVQRSIQFKQPFALEKLWTEMALFLHFPFKYLPPRWFMLLTLTWVFILSKRNSCCVYAKFQRSKDDTFLSLLAHLFLLFFKKKSWF